MKAAIWFCSVVFFMLVGMGAGIALAAAASLMFFGIFWTLGKIRDRLAVRRALDPASGLDRHY